MWQNKIPVTIITGYLGSGKTTLLNRVLADKVGEKSAVIVNEFGDIGIDSQLVSTTEEEIIEINKGCICCNVRSDLIRLLTKLLKRMQRNKVYFNRVIIETTGLANPGPVIQTFLMDDVMAQWFKIDAVVTVLDVKHLPYHLDEPEAKEQIAFSDVLLFNKTDLVSLNKLDNLVEQVSDMNQTAKQLFSVNSEIDTKQIIDIDSFQLGQKLELNPNLLDSHHHHHHSDVRSFVLKDDRPLHINKVNQWFSYLVQIKGENLFRYKGILYIKDYKERVVFQGVHMLFSGKQDRPWKKDEKKQSEIVFIGKDLDVEEFRKGFEYCMKE